MRIHGVCVNGFSITKQGTEIDDDRDLSLPYFDRTGSFKWKNRYGKSTVKDRLESLTVTACPAVVQAMAVDDSQRSL